MLIDVKRRLISIIETNNFLKREQGSILKAIQVLEGHFSNNMCLQEDIFQLGVKDFLFLPSVENHCL